MKPLSLHCSVVLLFLLAFFFEAKAALVVAPVVAVDDFDNPDFLGAGESAGGNSTPVAPGTSNFVNGDGTLNSDTWSITSTDSTTFRGTSAVAGADPGDSGIYAFTGPGVSTLGIHQAGLGAIHTTEIVLHVVNGTAISQLEWTVVFDVWLQNTVADATAIVTNWGHSLTGTPGSFTAENTGNVAGTTFGAPDSNWNRSTHAFTFQPNGATGIASGGDLYLHWQVDQAGFSAGSGDLFALGAVTVGVPEPGQGIVLALALVLGGVLSFGRRKRDLQLSSEAQ